MGTSVRKIYDAELLQLDTMLARMGHAAGGAIESAMTALRTGDTELAVMSNCENKEAAFEFYKFMTTGEGGTIWFKGTGKGLGTPNITATDEYAANRFQAVSAEGMAVAGILPPTETLSEFINNVWAPTNQQALLGEITPEEALEIMNEALNG